MDKIHQHYFYVQQKDISSCATIKSTKTNWKRVSDMSQDHSTKVLLQIKDPNITDLVVQEATNGIQQVLANPMYPVTVSASCG